ncbi:hypothetical protein BCT47_25840 [Vibrio splendidus]|uniref:Uncharacterized protein n=1 Tax=Vibrio tasmaniensis 1F-267 TaxID=1191324 RepID=A0ABX3B7P5_9VIBR|nr:MULTISPECIES: hypothetical protein [Vibrio]MCF7506364.1 hypothetical protein [Vibrio sp. L3-7]OEF51032.1 hypothetical protein A163_19895 [Vibrio tasmaniensis 1F-267]PMG56930.1 hypothetical protein BCU89_09370 [Vibrio splendidus]PMK11822.1 hypothetical protein BCU07_02015 [Vibrio sp. 10N.261.54.E10]PMM69389.1 hypothetical protein BCT47_25840 [Vibrio splendidus]
MMGRKYKIKYIINTFLILLLSAISFSSMSGSLEIDVTKINPSELDSIRPKIIIQNGEARLSKVGFSTEKLVLDKPLEHSEARKKLYENVKSMLEKNKNILADIEEGKIPFPNESTKSSVTEALQFNDDFLESASDTLGSDVIDSNKLYFSTSYKGENVVISEVKDWTALEKRSISQVMSDPDNIVNTRLNRPGAVKRASVENGREIIRDLKKGGGEIKKVTAFMISDVLETNYRRMGFSTPNCF